MKIHRYRFWCTECKDFTLHLPGDEGGCITCGTVTKTYKLSDVPDEKIQKQQRRYRDSQMNGWLSFMKPRKNILEELFNEDWENDIEVHECDAGWEKILEERNKIRQEERRILQEKKDDFNARFAHLGRNDKCGCGSGLKYKNCHLKEFQ